jgi:hypothetical protein
LSFFARFTPVVGLIVFDVESVGTDVLVTVFPLSGVLGPVYVSLVFRDVEVE